ncbi:Uncharacterised protein [Citrobacter freundii]|nr:Uncharacterised protein [Citrobacter freundii]
MMLLESFACFLTLIFFDFHQFIFQWICEVVQTLKNKSLFLLFKNFFDKVLEWGKLPFSNIPNAN